MKAPTLYPTAKLLPNPSNPRTITKHKLDKLVKSLRDFPAMLHLRPLVIQSLEEPVVLGGNMRLQALKALGVAEVPVLTAEELTEAQRAEFVIKDNVGFGEWDWDALANEWDPIELEEWGLDLPELPDEKQVTEDEVPELPTEPLTKPGDLWVLGRHRLLCGDATSERDVAHLLDGQRPELCLTDPPYGIGYEYATHDDSDNEKNAELVERVFALAPAFKVWTPGLPNLARDIGRFGRAKVLVWYKKFAAAGNGLGGASVWEPVLVVGRPAGKPKLPTDVLEILTDREEVNGTSLRELHSCPKPVELYAKLLEAFATRSALVYEPFCGSGTTLIACEQLGRTCFGMELDPAYCDVIVARWDQLTGKKQRAAIT